MRLPEDQTFYLAPRNPNDPRTRIDLTARSHSLTASQIIDHEALNWKATAATSSALSMAEYVFNTPELLTNPGLPYTI